MASSLCLDRSALRHDAPHRKLPRYVMASAVCSVGGFLFGMDTGIIGPVTTMKTFGSSLGHLSPIVQGLVVSAILLPAAATSFVAGYTADLLGRTRAIAIGSLIFGIGAAIEAGAVHIGMFVAGRIIAGIGEGLYLGTIVVYASFPVFGCLICADVRETNVEQVHLRNIASETSRGACDGPPAARLPRHHGRLFYVLRHH